MFIMTLYDVDMLAMHVYLKSQVRILYVVHTIMHTDVRMDIQTYIYTHAHDVTV